MCAFISSPGLLFVDIQSLLCFLPSVRRRTVFLTTVRVSSTPCQAATWSVRCVLGRGSCCRSSRSSTGSFNSASVRGNCGMCFLLLRSSPLFSSKYEISVRPCFNNVRCSPEAHPRPEGAPPRHQGAELLPHEGWHSQGGKIGGRWSCVETL